MKKFCLLLALILCFGLTAPGFASGEEPVHLTVGIASQPTVIDHETNRMTQLIEERLNVDLEFVTFTTNEYIEKLNVMIQTGGEDLPDMLIFGFTGKPTATGVYNWALNGAVIPITDYVKNDSPNLHASMEEAEVDLIPLLTMPDGEIYYLPGYARSLGNEYQHKLWIYQPWLDKLGLEAPVDAESLRTVLRAFKEQDPNGNGIADEIPMMGYTKYSSYIPRAILSMFCDVGNTADFIAVKDGKLIASYTTGEYREGLRYLHSLFDEGLISPLTFTQDQSQFNAVMSGETTIVGMSVLPSLATSMSATDPRRAEYVGIAPLRQADGSVLTPFTPTVPSVGFVITSNCKNPDAAFRVGDLLCSEEFTVMNRWGEKDVDWVTPGEDAVAMYAALGYAPYLMETGNISWGSPQNQNWYNQGPYVRGYKIPAGMVWNGDPLDSEYIIAQIMPEYINKGPAEYIAALTYTEEENEILAEPLSTIDSYVLSSLAQFATGDLDIETDWDSYISELNNIGLDDVLTVMQAAYDRAK